MSRVAMARWAWAMSLAIHAGALGGLCFSWHEAPTVAAGMDVEAICFDAQVQPNVNLAAEVPRVLPAVTALPLAEPATQQMFEPIVQVAASSPIANALPPTQPTPLPSPPRAGLPPGTATIFFGVPASGASVIYVIDRSASMGLEGRLQRATHEAALSLAQLPVNSRTQVIVYARAPEPLCPGLVSPQPDIVAAATDRLLHLTAEGGTDHVRALKSALVLNPDVIYFLTDEDDLTPADVKTVTDYNRGRTVIHTICLVDPGSTTTPIGELARRNRGQFRVAR